MANHLKWRRLPLLLREESHSLGAVGLPDPLYVLFRAKKDQNARNIDNTSPLSYAQAVPAGREDEPSEDRFCGPAAKRTPYTARPALPAMLRRCPSMHQRRPSYDAAYRRS
jgi:hypothetical protein